MKYVQGVGQNLYQTTGWMKMTKKKDTEAISVKAPQEICFYFDEKDFVPKNFDELGIDTEVVVTIKGKITALSHSVDSRSFSISCDKVKITIPDSEPIGVGEALEKIKEGRKS